MQFVKYPSIYLYYFYKFFFFHENVLSILSVLCYTIVQGLQILPLDRE